MEENDGFATLGFLNQNVLLIPDCKWKTKTPFASIRRIVQDKRFFFKIKPGLWALKSHKDEVLKKFSIQDKSEDNNTTEFNHSYYQGLLVEIGNLKKFQTFIPNQDKNKKFLNKPLKDITTLNSIHNFSFENIVSKAKTVDVSWFNDRKLPYSMFEVEHSTDIYNSLLKFVELQDFRIKFYIVSSENRKREYKSKISLSAFNPINDKVTFIDYNYLSNWHAKSFELISLERKII